MSLLQIGPYTVERELARDGSRTVYAARGPSGPVTVHRLEAPGPDLEALARLRHDHIVPILAAGKSDGAYYVATEAQPAETLAERIAQGPTPSLDAARLLLPIARALHYAHTQGVFHRNVTPDAIRLDAGGRARLTGFGAAAAKSEYSGPGSADARYDVYSLGATLYALASGRPCSYPAYTLPALAPLVPVDLDTILSKAIKREPELRYATAAELADDLERFSRAERIHAQPLKRTQRFILAAKRNRWSVLALISFLAVATAMGVYLWIRPGTLVLDVQPADAQIWIDDAIGPLRASDAPRLSLAHGSHRLRVEREGYAAVLLEAQVERGSDTTVPIRLSPLTGILTVKATPEDGRVEFIKDGKVLRRALSTAKPEPLPLGRITVKVEREGFYTARQEFEIAPNSETTWVIPLRPAELYSTAARPRSRMLACGGAIGVLSPENELTLSIWASTIQKEIIGKIAEVRALNGSPVVWVVGPNGSSDLIAGSGGKPLWTSEAFCTEVFDTLDWDTELWIFSDAGVARLDARTGKRLGLHPALPKGEARVIDVAARRWALGGAKSLQIREGPEKILAEAALEIGVRSAADPSGRVVFADKAGRVRVLDPSTLKELWATPAGVAGDFCVGSLTEGAPVIVATVSDDGRVRAWDAEGRKLAEWQTDGHPAAPPVFADMNGDGIRDLVLLTSRRLLACDALSGSIVWDVALPDEQPRDLAISDMNGDGLLDAAVQFDGAVRVYSGSRILWSHSSSDRVNLPALCENQTAALNADDLTLTAIDARSGRRTWSRTLPSASRAPPAIFPGLPAFVVPCDRSGLIAFDAGTGKTVWEGPLIKGGVEQRPVVQDMTGDGQSDVFVVEQRKIKEVLRSRLYCLEARTGTQRWRRDIEGAILGDVTISGAWIFAATAEGVVYGLNGRDGSLLWEQPLGGGVTQPLGMSPDRRLVVAVETGRIAMLEPDGGKRVQEFPSGEKPTQGIWLTVGGRPHFVWGDGAGNLTCLNYSTGAVRWTRRLGQAISAAPVLLPGPRIAVSADRTRVLEPSAGQELWSVGDRGSMEALELSGGGRAALAISTGSTLLALNIEGHPWSSSWSGRRGSPSGDRCVGR